jgi:hypothetical protein
MSYGTLVLTAAFRFFLNISLINITAQRVLMRSLNGLNLRPTEVCQPMVGGRIFDGTSPASRFVVISACFF